MSWVDGVQPDFDVFSHHATRVINTKAAVVMSMYVEQKRRARFKSHFKSRSGCEHSLQFRRLDPIYPITGFEHAEQ